jgi:hypothetical protein
VDFFHIRETLNEKKGEIEIVPDFIVGRSKDLMVQGGDFYAIYNAETGLWSRDKYDVPILVDKEIREYAEKAKKDGLNVKAKFLRSFNTNTWKQFNTFLKNVSDNSHPLDTTITFANTEVEKKSYASRRLPYSLAAGDISAYDELVSVLYTPEERHKFEWAIGAVISGDAKRIEKYIVFYGPGGTGKSTIMKIIQMLFGGLVRDGGYIATFVAKDLVGNNNSFATSAFKDNPLVAIQHDGDLSKIEDNSKLNSIVSHEVMQINEKYKTTYDNRINAFLFMGTNKPVKMTDAKSGLIRRTIDVRPTGNKLDPERYFELMGRIEFELGAIAHHCLDVYKTAGKNYYNGYEPEGMMLQTDVFYNFVVAHYDIFKQQDGTSLTQAYNLWKDFVVDEQLEFKMPRYKFREALKDFFDEFYDRGYIVDGREIRSYYKGFVAKPLEVQVNEMPKEETEDPHALDSTVSIFDEMYGDLPAQYATDEGTPTHKWANVKTTLADLDTTKLHYVNVPAHHIVIDFDLKGADGQKSLELNLEAAKLWPPTYTEVSKSGEGLHKHYLYEGDPSELASVYSPGIEIKVYAGDASLRRKLSKCNDLPIATINSGLPFKEKKTMLDAKVVQNEQKLRELIGRALAKDYEKMPSTKQNIDFIKKLLDDAYATGMVYDVLDMKPDILKFANHSTNQALQCIRTVRKMPFQSEVQVEDVELKNGGGTIVDDRRTVFDCEVFPNLFVICWMYEDSDTVIRMINPSAFDVEALFQHRLVGYNNRFYDNHILYAAANGANNQQLYELSQKLVSKDKKLGNNARFGAAYGLSYADVIDYISITPKPSLKELQVKYGLRHVESDLPWDQPAPPEKWMEVVEYCANDVVTLRDIMLKHEQDFKARQILASLSGLSVNDPTRKHVARYLFGNNHRDAQKEFVYTDLREEFPGYEFDQFAVKGEQSTYRGHVVGEGGFVYAVPGIWENVGLLDVESMHPHSIKALNLFGRYTEKFVRLIDARLALKNGDRARFEELLPGVDWPETKEDKKALSDAMKLALNSCYGWTAASGWENEFTIEGNVDNIVAKRGALFMVDLLCFLQDKGIQVVHIKTDSVKIPGITPEIVEMVQEFGRKYGYNFKHEATYRKMCLVNDAVYIARVQWTEDEGDVDRWTATGAQFKHPVVFKAAFTEENITFEDLCETKKVQGDWAMFLDYDEAVATPATPYKGMHFVGKSGKFLPVYKDAGGAKLVKLKNREGKPYAVSNTSGHLWLEADLVRQLNLNAVDRMLFEDLTQAVADSGSITDVVDMSYYENLVQEAIEAVNKFGKYEEFVK